MKMIQPNCRVQFTADDISFIAATLSRDPGNQQCLVQLLADEDTRDEILDDRQLYQAVLEHRGCLRISDHLYFYIVVRRVLREAGIEDRRVADYVAELLCEFSRQDRSRCALPGENRPMEYVFEMLAAMQNADERTRFYLKAHIGDHSLFLSGVFPERIRFRAEYRGFPDLSYYEAMGQTNYRAAGDHRLAERYELAPIFSILAEQFHEARVALNDVSERLFSIGDANQGLDALLLNFKPEASF